MRESKRYTAREAPKQKQSPQGHQSPRRRTTPQTAGVGGGAQAPCVLQEAVRLEGLEGVDRHVLLREAGAKPLLTYWARSLVRFYNKIRDRERVGASQLLSDALESDLILARSGGCGSCWSAELAQGLGQLDPAWGQAVLQGHPMDQASVMQAVHRTLVVGPWQGGMVSILHRKRSLYAAMCSLLAWLA